MNFARSVRWNRLALLRGPALVAAVCLAATAGAQRSDSIWSDGRLIEPEPDEAILWRESDSVERWLVEQSEMLHEDRELEDYLTGIARDLMRESIGTAEPRVRVRVLKNPELNAFALANGALFLHTGILARMDNEAQLAILIGHELTHYLYRHQYREMRAQRRRMILGAIFGGLLGAAVGGADFGQLGAQLGGQAGQIFAIASVSGYSRNREREADEVGLRAAAALGYDPREGLVLFDHLRREIESLGLSENFFFATHPRVVERIESFQSLIDGGLIVPAEIVVREDAFLRQIIDVLLENAELDLGIGHEETARTAIERHLQLEPESARGYFLMGEYHRHVGRVGRDYDEAIANYELALGHDPEFAGAYLELGLLGRVIGDDMLSRNSFRHYLELRPAAIDRGVVESYLEEFAIVPAIGALGLEASQ